jgi:hypothetical protein
MKLQGLLRDKLKGDSITTGALRKIPQLKSCPHWDRATFLGCVRHSLGFVSYDGGLVSYEDRVYYVNRSQIEALRAFVRWNLKKAIRVTDNGADSAK